MVPEHQRRPAPPRSARWPSRPAATTCGSAATSPTTNGVGQQGLTRFTNATPGAAPAKPAKLLPYSVQPGVVQIHFPTVLDNDDSTLTYRLLKGFSNTTIATWTAKLDAVGPAVAALHRHRRDSG